MKYMYLHLRFHLFFFLESNTSKSESIHYAMKLGLGLEQIRMCFVLTRLDFQNCS